MNADVELSMMDVELDAIASLDAELMGINGMVSSFVNFDQSTFHTYEKPFLMVDITMQLSNASRNIDVKLVRFTVKIRLDAKETIFT